MSLDAVNHAILNHPIGGLVAVNFVVPKHVSMDIWSEHSPECIANRKSSSDQSDCKLSAWWIYTPRETTTSPQNYIINQLSQSNQAVFRYFCNLEPSNNVIVLDRRINPKTLCFEPNILQLDKLAARYYEWFYFANLGFYPRHAYAAFGQVSNLPLELRSSWFVNRNRDWEVVTR